MKWNLPILIVALTFTGNQVFAQCCSQGTPMGGSGNLGLMKKNHFQAVNFYKYSQSVSQKSPNPYNITNASFNFIGTALSYGITSRLTGELELGYFIGKTQNYQIGDIAYTVNGYGFSNGFLSAKFGILKSIKWDLVAGIGLKFPFSRNYQSIDLVQVPLDNQPSTCGFGLAPKILLFRKFEEKGLNLFLFHRTDFNFANRYGYAYGHGFSTAFFVSKRLDFISKKALGVMQIRYDKRTKDVKADGTKLEVTGSDVFFVCPQFGYTFYKKIFLSGSYELPVFQKFSTEKLKYRHAFTVNLVLNF